MQPFAFHDHFAVFNADLAGHVFFGFEEK